ncbi:helix-turn-helix domain-containing protein [Anaerobacillus isosaccharinicus]|uniref:Helix-turn-helix transcriptional regulator n=1 Tax=Anaerobacillus isosaccharinicus TaxID=1532552 RepID=A0A1S2LXI7_9BACI|nr:helix-turn-helix domain-containing protein [Anaerobacillus isosaccharinicus]MBA5588907.1 helix-turn-helix transcriptional regulator [Anaerobacillus isosaccharinicus]QOY37717.1 helix-turn-helix transcriptional regulator [Anaerobacillus isosaccharinicus]
MDYNIGCKIKELRKYWNMTQAELAHDICSQAMVSTIEKNENVFISAQLLFQISQRLGVNIDYFFQDTKLPKYNYVNDVCEQITTLIQSKKYNEAYEMVRLEKKNPHFSKVNHLKQFLLWREAICINYLKGNKLKALELLDESLSYSETSYKNYSVREIEIFISKAILLNELQRWTEADELYTKILHYAKKSPAIRSNAIFINIYYNAARNANMLKDYKKAHNFCNEGILICKKEQSVFLLGYLYYLKAQTLFKINGKYSEEILKLYKEALWVFEK